MTAVIAPRLNLIHRVTVQVAHALHHVDHLADMPHHFNPVVAALLAANAILHARGH